MIDQVLITIAIIALDVWTVLSMLALGFGLTLNQVLGPLRDGRNVFLTLLASFVLVPALALTITFALPLGDSQRSAIILLGVCAGGPFIPQLVRMIKGDTALAASNMTLLLVVTIFYVPLALPVLIEYVQVDALVITKDLILFLLFPFFIGLLIRRQYESRATIIRPHLVRAASISLLVMVGVSILPALPRVISTIGTWLIPGAVLLAVGGTLIGYVIAFGRLSGKREVFALETGQRNLAAALLVAAGGYGYDTFIMTMIGALTLTVAMHIITAGWARRIDAGRSLNKME